MMRQPEVVGKVDGPRRRTLVDWWRDNPEDPDRPAPDDPAVRRLIDKIASGSQTVDLGGVMSLNALIEPPGLVLRVHQPFVSRHRLLAVGEVRRQLAARGVIVPVPLTLRGSAVFPCGRRWAELERYIPHRKLSPSVDSYIWLFGALGVLHRELARLKVTVPRPLVATFAPPGSLRRWLPVTERAVEADREALEVVSLLRELTPRLGALWVPARKLQVGLVHGDVRHGNLGRTPDGGTLYLDFGFMASRPLVHDLAYSLAYMVLALGGAERPEAFDWEIVPRMLGAYEAEAGRRVTTMEKRALAPYIAAVPLYHVAIAGYARDPAGVMRAGRPFLQLSEWLLAHPTVV